LQQNTELAVTKGFEKTREIELSEENLKPVGGGFKISLDKI